MAESIKWLKEYKMSIEHLLVLTQKFSDKDGNMSKKTTKITSKGPLLAEFGSIGTVKAIIVID